MEPAVITDGRTLNELGTKGELLFHWIWIDLLADESFLRILVGMQIRVTIISEYYHSDLRRYANSDFYLLFVTISLDE